MNATSQAQQHWSQQHISSSATARNPLGGHNAKSPHFSTSSMPSSIDNDRHRYERDRRLNLESEQSRQYLNTLTTNRHGALPPPPAHGSLPSRPSSKTSNNSAYSLSHSLSNPIHKSQKDPGPPPPLVNNDGSALLPSSSNAKGVSDPRYGHLPPTSSSYKPITSQPYERDLFGSHHRPPHPRRDTISGPLTSHQALHPSLAVAHGAATQRGISPVSSISPPDDLRRAATQFNAAQQNYKYPSPSYSPGSQPQCTTASALALQNRASPVGSNSSAGRQRVNSPAAPGQVYGKPSLPTRTVEARRGFSPGPHTENHASAGTNLAPPPAHGGSGAGRTTSHDHHNDPRNDPRYLIPSNHMTSNRKPQHQPYNPSTSVGGPASYDAHLMRADINQGRAEEAPLDLGVSAKRRSEQSSDSDTVFNLGVSPRKTSKLEPTSGLLFKVSEPSVLITSEPSEITTVINSALVKEEKTTIEAHNLSTSHKPVASALPDDQQSYKSGAGSESSYTQRSITPASKADSPPNKEDVGLDKSKKAGYVHKLKKAWINAYSTNDDASTTSSTGRNEQSIASNQHTPVSTGTRTTPSPALSNKSSASGSSSIMTGKPDAKRKTFSQSGSISKPGTPQSFNGHSASPRRAGGGSNNKETDYGSDVTSDTGCDKNSDSSGEDESISLRSKRLASSTSGRGRKAGKQQKASNLRLTSRLRGARTRNARNNASVRNRKSASEESSADDEEVNSSDNSKRSDRSTNRKRGREKETKGTKTSSKKEEPRSKKEKSEAATDDVANGAEESINPFRRPDVVQLKKTGESFLQDKPCLKEAPRLTKCRECRLTESQRNKQMPNIFCRFYAFRRLKYSKNGKICVAGFCDPNRDYSEEDDALWNVSPKSAPKNLNLDQAKYLIENIRTDFDLIMKQERRAVEIHSGEGKFAMSINLNKIL